MATTLAEITYDLSLRSPAQQEASLNELRSRTGVLFLLRSLGTVRDAVARKSGAPRTKPLTLPRESYLPEFGPAPTKVKRPSHVLEIPPELYLLVGGRPKRDDKK